jgi:hypothetical protein
VKRQDEREATCTTESERWVSLLGHTLYRFVVLRLRIRGRGKASGGLAKRLLDAVNAVKALLMPIGDRMEASRGVLRLEKGER